MVLEEFDLCIVYPGLVFPAHEGRVATSGQQFPSDGPIQLVLKGMAQEPSILMAINESLKLFHPARGNNPSY